MRSRGVNRLDGLILTHGQAKATGGAPEAVGDFSPREVFVPPFPDRSAARGALQAGLAGAALSPVVAARGNVLELAKDVRLRILYPPPDLAHGRADDRALVLQLEAGGSKILLMSDGGYFTEHWLMDHGSVARTDIVIKGQNSGDLSGSLDFLEAAAPEAILSASGKYSPLSDSWAAEVAARGMKLFRQDETGAVHIDVRQGDLTLRAFLGGETFRRTEPAVSQ